MTTETETVSLATGINGGDGSDAKITRVSATTSKSIASNGVQVYVWVGHTGIVDHQGWGGRGGRFNHPEYTSFIRKFKVKVDGFGTVLGTTAEQREFEDQYKNFSKNLKQYIQLEFRNTEDIIVLIRDLKYPTTVLNTSRPTALSTEDRKNLTMVMIQTEEIKQYL